MRIYKITEQYFKEVKQSLNSKKKWTRFTKRNIEEVANKHGISYKTVMQIKNCVDYQDYVEINKSQHPEVKYSLKEDVLKLHKLLFDYKDNKYITPASAKEAIGSIIYYIEKTDA